MEEFLKVGIWDDFYFKSGIKSEDLYSDRHLEGQILSEYPILGKNTQHHTALYDNISITIYIRSYKKV